MNLEGGARAIRNLKLMVDKQWIARFVARPRETVVLERFPFPINAAK